MFHWICPECGQEIAPGVKECPVCDPQASASPVPTPIVDVKAETKPIVQPIIQPAIQAIVQTAGELQLEVVPLALLAAPAGEIPQLEPQVVPRPHPVQETFADRLADLAEHLQDQRVPYDVQRLTAMPRRETERAPVILDVTPAKVDVTSGSPSMTASASPLSLAEPQVAGNQRVPYDVQRLTAIPRRETERAPVILDVTPAKVDVTSGKPTITASASTLLLAEPQPPSIAAEIPLEQIFNPQPVAHPEADRTIRSQPANAEPSAPSPIQLPDHPGELASPALGPFQDYYEAADRLMRPVALAANAVRGAAEPKMTLPGPAIPRELMSLQAAGLVPMQAGRRHGQSANRYGWTGKIAGMAILLTAGIAATYRMVPGISANPPAQPNSAVVQEQPVAAKPDNSHSLARFVEVTGIRFLEVNKKPQLHYLVVNHSSAPLSSMTVYLTLRVASAKPGQAPLSRFTFRSPDLAAFEAKEMASPIERISSSFNLPDWQDLRAEVDVQ